MKSGIGHRRIGTGEIRAIVTNDWLGDTTTWDPCLPYLDTAMVSWVFADLRGYGASRHLPGPYNATQAAADVLSLADRLGWERFITIGHSMSTIVSLHLAQQQQHRIDRAILITPPPPTGGATREVLNSAKQIALGAEPLREAALKAMWGPRLSDGWIAYKLRQWRAAADPDAVAEYVDMFAKHGLPDRSRRIDCPVIAIAGDQDPNPLMRPDAVAAELAPLCTRLRVLSLPASGHYPMQEIPPMFATTIEQTLTSAPPE